MKRIFSIISAILFATALYAQPNPTYGSEQIYGGSLFIDDDSPAVYLLTNTGDTLFVRATGDTLTIQADTLVIDGEVYVRIPGGRDGYALVDDGGGRLRWSPLATPVDTLTYDQAVDSSQARALIPNGYYFISDSMFYLQAYSDTLFKLEGYYERFSGVLHKIELDFENRHVQKEMDNYGNSVGSTYNFISFGLVPYDPRSVFRWGDPTCTGNIVWNAVFDCAASTGLVYDNLAIERSENTLSGDGTWNDNVMKGASALNASSFTGSSSLVIFGGGIDIDMTGMSGDIQLSIFGNSGTIDFTGFTGSVSGISCLSSSLTASGTPSFNNLTIVGSTLDISGTATANRACFAGGSENILSGGNSDDVIASSGVKFIISGGDVNGSKLYGDTVLVSGNCNAPGLYVGKFSDFFCSDDARATNAQLTQGNRLDISDSVNAVSVYMSTGAYALISGNGFIEGQIFRNVDTIIVSGDVTFSPGEVENQSIVRLDGTGNYGNAFWKGVYFTGTDSANATNCQFLYAQIRLDSAADVSNSYVFLDNQYTHTLYYKNTQQNQYVTTQRSTKAENIYFQNDTFSFTHDSLWHWLGRGTSTENVTINTITGLSAAPRYFRFYVEPGDTIFLDATTATNIILPNNIYKVIASGSNGNWIDLEHDGSNVYVSSSSNAILYETVIGEMGFGDSLSTIALTQNTPTWVTNSGNDLWSSGAVDTVNVTYSNDSIIVNVNGYYFLHSRLNGDAALNDEYKFTYYKNGAPTCVCDDQLTSPLGGTIRMIYTDNLYLKAGDVLVPMLENIANDNDFDAISGKVVLNFIGK